MAIIFQAQSHPDQARNLHPLFAGLAFGFSRLGGVFQASFTQIAAFAIFLLAIFNLNNGVALTGSNITLDRAWTGFWCTVSFCDNSPIFASSATPQVAGAQVAPVEEATISIEAASYNPNYITVKAGSTVTLNLVNNGGRGCTQAFTIPRLGIQKIIPLGRSETIRFTAPSEPTQLAFMCSMGMFRGTIRVI